MEVRKQTLLLADLAGYTRAVAALDADALAGFLESYYAVCATAVADAGGRVVKFLGDACLAAFPPQGAEDAIAAAQAIVAGVGPLAGAAGWSLSVGASIHVATVAVGDIGPAACRQHDVIGAGVNHLFRMGGGPGLRISEPAYRQLPEGRRARWRKHRPPATYTYTG